MAKKRERKIRTDLTLRDNLTVEEIISGLLPKKDGGGLTGLTPVVGKEDPKKKKKRSK